MQAQRLQHERANPRLAKAVARDEGKLGVGAAMAGRLCAEDQQTAAAALSHSRVLCRFCTTRFCWLAAGQRSMQPTWGHLQLLTPLPHPCWHHCSEDPLAILKDEEEKVHDSDEEWRTIRERAAARHVVKTAPKVGWLGCPLAVGCLSALRCGCCGARVCEGGAQDAVGWLPGISAAQLGGSC